jgi:uncharacterized protein YxjI
MRYQLKQKIWTLGDTFAIKDGDGNDVFLVKGKVFSRSAARSRSQAESV